jgi:hypothetical protein
MTVNKSRGAPQSVTKKCAADSRLRAKGFRSIHYL